MHNLINIPDEVKKHLSDLIVKREAILEEGRAQSNESQVLRMRIDAILEKYNIEFCSHNFALLGSNRYKKWKIDKIDFLITKEQFEKLVVEESQ